MSGGTTVKGGQIEVNLDIQVAMGGAPDAHWRTYIAPNNLALLPTMLAKMRSEGVTIVLDSWGLCELFVPIKLASAENVALEQLALAGVSFYVASGDDGAADCRAANPDAKFLAIDDPSGHAVCDGCWRDEPPDPTARIAHREGVEGLRRRDLDQLAEAGLPARRPHAQRAGGFCSTGTAQCRETPDIAMDAAPQTGYTICCHGLGGSRRDMEHRRRHERGGAAHGGITADTNESRRRCESARLREPIHLRRPA